MRRIHFPILLGNLEERHAQVFVGLFALESICRSIVIAVVPLLAYEHLGSARNVSILYFFVSFTGLAIALLTPMVLGRIPRRWILTAGCLAYLGAAVLFAVAEPGVFVAGMIFQILGTATLEIVINLYLLDHIKRKELNLFEPRRLVFVGLSFVIGPALGVYLAQEVSAPLPFAVTGLAAILLLVYFWILRLGDNAAIQPARKSPPNPLRFVPRFVAQKRLLLAWTLAVGRNGWWSMFYVYTPIYVAASGYNASLGGLLVSLGAASLLLVKVWGRIGQRYGIRRLLLAGYLATGFVSIIAGLAADNPPACMVFLCLAAACATLIDGAGNVPFLRAVHPHERAEMTSVFMTFRHVAALVTPGIFAIVLIVFPLKFVFITGGVAMLAMAALTRLLPRRL